MEDVTPKKQKKKNKQKKHTTENRQKPTRETQMVL